MRRVQLNDVRVGTIGFELKFFPGNDGIEQGPDLPARLARPCSRCQWLVEGSHDLAARLAKRRGFDNAKDPKDWQTVERVRTLYKKLEAADLAPLLFEAILLSSAGSVAPDRPDDPLVTAAGLARVNVQAIRLAVAKEERKKEERKKKEKGPKKTHGH